MDEGGEKTHLLHSDPGIHVYKRRWYILALFSFLALYQCAIWNTWGPVVDSVSEVWDWDTETVSLFANWGCIAFLVFMVPILYLQDYYLRSAVVLSSGLVALATSIRCLFLIFPDLSHKNFTLLCHISAILNGIPSIVVTAAPAAVSAAWFPPHERVTATSISQMLNNVGQGLSFLIAGLMVRETPHHSNSSHHHIHSNSSSNSSLTDVSKQVIQHNSTGTEQVKTQLQNYLVLLAVPAILLFILVLFYFPNKPPSPPSKSSQEARMDFWPGAIELVSNPNSWGLAVVWAIPQAVWNNWCALMVVSLTKVGTGGEYLTENWVSYLGLIAVLVGTFAAIMVGTATGRIKGMMKRTIMLLLIAGGILFTLLAMLSLQIIQMPNMLLLQIFVYIFILLGNSCVVSTSPLLFEFGVEKLYPISEGMIGGWLNIWFNIISVIFLGLFSIPNIGTRWLSYVLPVSCFSVLPLMSLIKEEYKRRNVDEEESFEEEKTVDTEGEHEENQLKNETNTNYGSIRRES